MITMDKKGEIKEFTDQVRVICVKNGKNKPTLGEKIGMNNTIFFNSIKNNSLKIDPQTYFKLEKEICGKDEHYKSKLRRKYEKTLTLQEMGEYMKVSEEVDGRGLRKKSVKPIEEEPAKINIENANINAFKKSNKQNDTTDKESKKKFYKLVSENRKTGISINKLEEILGNSRLHNMKGGWSCIPTKDLPKLFEAMGLTSEDPIYHELVELQLSCIAGPNEEQELTDYEKMFGSASVKVESDDIVKENKEEKEVGYVDANICEYQLKDFADILTKWLFMKGYTFKQAARNIGCSEEELKSVINANDCLSPYHVNRFKETLNMDDETINKLVTISNKLYKGHEVPESLIRYISSDISIIKALSEIAKQNKSAQFWNKIMEEL